MVLAFDLRKRRRGFSRMMLEKQRERQRHEEEQMEFYRNPQQPMHQQIQQPIGRTGDDDRKMNAADGNFNGHNDVTTNHKNQNERHGDEMIQEYGDDDDEDKILDFPDDGHHDKKNKRVNSVTGKSSVPSRIDVDAQQPDSGGDDDDDSKVCRHEVGTNRDDKVGAQTTTTTAATNTVALSSSSSVITTPPHHHRRREGQQTVDSKDVAMKNVTIEKNISPPSRRRNSNSSHCDDSNAWTVSHCSLQDLAAAATKAPTISPKTREVTPCMNSNDRKRKATDRSKSPPSMAADCVDVTTTTTAAAIVTAAGRSKKKMTGPPQPAPITYTVEELLQLQEYHQGKPKINYTSTEEWNYMKQMKQKQHQIDFLMEQLRMQKEEMKEYKQQQMKETVKKSRKTPPKQPPPRTQQQRQMMLRYDQQELQQQHQQNISEHHLPLSSKTVNDDDNDVDDEEENISTGLIPSPLERFYGPIHPDDDDDDILSIRDQQKQASKSVQSYSNTLTSPCLMNGMEDDQSRSSSTTRATTKNHNDGLSSTTTYIDSISDGSKSNPINKSVANNVDRDAASITTSPSFERNRSVFEQETNQYIQQIQEECNRGITKLRMKYQNEMDRRVEQCRTDEKAYRLKLENSHKIEMKDMKDQFEKERLSFQSEYNQMSSTKNSEIEELQKQVNELNESFLQYKKDTEVHNQTIRDMHQQQLSQAKEQWDRERTSIEKVYQQKLLEKEGEIKQLDQKHKDEINQHLLQYQHAEKERIEQMHQTHQYEITELKERNEVQIQSIQQEFQQNLDGKELQIKKIVATFDIEKNCMKDVYEAEIQSYKDKIEECNEREKNMIDEHKQIVHDVAEQFKKLLFTKSKELKQASHEKEMLEQKIQRGMITLRKLVIQMGMDASNLSQGENNGGTTSTTPTPTLTPYPQKHDDAEEQEVASISLLSQSINDSYQNALRRIQELERKIIRRDRTIQKLQQQQVTKIIPTTTPTARQATVAISLESSKYTTHPIENGNSKKRKSSYEDMDSLAKVGEQSQSPLRNSNVNRTVHDDIAASDNMALLLRQPDKTLDSNNVIVYQRKAPFKIPYPTIRLHCHSRRRLPLVSTRHSNNNHNAT